MPTNKIPLSSLRIEKPCSMNWEAMSGDDRSRFCAQCQHHVHNLSTLTERQIQKLLATDQRVCGRLTHDASGRLITQPERGPLAWLQRKTSTFKLALTSILAAVTATPAQSAEPPPKSTPSQSSTEKPSAQPSTAKEQPRKESAPPPKAEADEEIIILSGFIICEQPKPPSRKKYKK